MHPIRCLNELCFVTEQIPWQKHDATCPRNPRKTIGCFAKV